MNKMETWDYKLLSKKRVEETGTISFEMSDGSNMEAALETVIENWDLLGKKIVECFLTTPDGQQFHFQKREEIERLIKLQSFV